MQKSRHFFDFQKFPIVCILVPGDKFLYFLVKLDVAFLLRSNFNRSDAPSKFLKIDNLVDQNDSSTTPNTLITFCNPFALLEHKHGKTQTGSAGKTKSPFQAHPRSDRSLRTNCKQ